MKIKNYFRGAILVIAVTLLLRLPYVLLVPILDVDETNYAARATSVISSGGILYVDVVADTQPLMNYLYLAVFRSAGTNNIFAVQLLGVIWTLMTTFVLYRIAGVLGGGRAAFLAAIFYAVCSTTFDPREMTAANAELFMVLPLAAGALFFLRGLRDRSSRDYWLAGSFCAAGFLFKQPGIVDLGAMFLFLVFIYLARKITLKEAGKRAALVLAGFLGPVLVVLAYLFYQGALKEFYFWTWVYRFKYVVAVPLALGARTALTMLRRLAAPNFIFWISVLISILFLRRLRFKSGYAFCWLWGVFSLAGAAAGRRPAHHYYIQVIPPFAVLAGLGAASALDWILSRKKKAWWGVVLKSAIAVSLAAAVFITHPGPSLGYMYGPAFRRLYRFQRLKHPEQGLANYIRENTSESDSIYTWGFFPEIYFLADRHPASRFILADFITGASPGGISSVLIQDVWETFMKDLELNRPVYFIDISLSYLNWIYADHPIARYPLLWKYLHANYKLENVIDKKLVYRRRKEALAAQELPLPEDESLRTVHDATLALEFDPGFAEAYFFRGLAFFRLEQNQGALADFNRALEIDPKIPVDYNVLGILYRSEGKIAAAISQYEKAVSIDSLYRSAHHNLAAALDQSGDFERAARHYRRAIELDPGFVPAYRDLGFAYAKAGLLAAASAEFKKAVELEPESGLNYYCLALCYYFQGDHAAAILYRDEAIRFGYREIHEKIMKLK